MPLLYRFALAFIILLLINVASVSGAGVFSKHLCYEEEETSMGKQISPEVEQFRERKKMKEQQAIERRAKAQGEKIIKQSSSARRKKEGRVVM